MKISAIIPAYNASSFIKEAITSIQVQTRPVDEIIVIDDASTDGTAELARALGAQVCTLQENSGSGAARNKGLRAASGDAIAWLDADDYWAPSHIEILEALLKNHPTASVAAGAVQRFGLRHEIIRGYAPYDSPGNIFWSAVKDWIHPIIGALIVRKALLSIGGFSTDKRASEDYDMWLRLSRNHLFIGTPEVTSYWRWHQTQQSQAYGAQLAAVYYYRRKFLDSELRNNSPEEAGRFASIMRTSWKADFDTGCVKRDYQLCNAIYDAREQIPGLSPVAMETRQSALLALEKNDCKLLTPTCLRCWFGCLATRASLGACGRLLSSKFPILNRIRR
jgi:GT2 family glycosyltransferase